MQVEQRAAAATARDSDRFGFGANWRRFLADLDDERIAQAEASLRDMLGTQDLTGRSFLDIGSGSGLFSLAAHRLGARVHSFDYDADSVACTRELRRRYGGDADSWTVEAGSVLDGDYLTALGVFDVVYSWGVLHHTGAMWTALDNAVIPTRSGGKLFIAIYNHQERATAVWTRIKRVYNRLPPSLRFLVLWPCFVRLWGPTTVRDLLRGRPMHTWRNYADNRGMSPWRNVVDWVGGYPFEAARPEQIFDFYRERGFRLSRLTTCGGGRGCNEFVFDRIR